MYLAFQENYFGDDNIFRDFDQGFINLNKSSPVGANATKKEFDARHHRPLTVCVQVTLHDIQGHLMKVNNPSTISCDRKIRSWVDFAA
jgi:hypothetical protein